MSSQFQGERKFFLINNAGNVIALLEFIIRNVKIINVARKKWVSMLKINFRLGAEAEACNLSCFGGRDQEDHGWRPALVNSL
jgi:hypothetical protein